MPESNNTPLQTRAGILVQTVKSQIQTAVKFRQPRLDEIQKSENLYFNKKERTLRGRFNIPLPIMSGFVDTLMAKVDEEPVITFEATEDADKIRARKVQGLWTYDSAPTRGMWAIKDILEKKLAIFSGRGISKIYSESDPEYKNNYDVVDPFDFLCEPQGGWYLENHLFCGQENIFKTKSDLLLGAQSGLYDKIQVQLLVASSGTAEYKKNEALYLNKQRRFGNLGLEVSNNNYVGQAVFCLTEWVFDYEGTRYYMLLEPISGLWIRFGTLGDIFDHNLLPWVSWATHYDAWNFWSKAPVDDVRPVAEGLKVMANFMFDNVQKKLWGQRIYDPEMITDPSQLEWDRPDKLIEATVPAGKAISQGVYQFETGDNSQMVINVVDYFNSFLGRTSGVTNDSQGESKEKLVGIAVLNEKQVADRLGLYNKFYKQAQAEKGLRYYLGTKLIDEKLSIRMVGEEGYESVDITKDDLNFVASPNIRITGGQSEAKQNELMAEARKTALTTVIQFAPESLNKRVAIEEILTNSHWEKDKITALLDVSAAGNEEESVAASQAIQDILSGKTPELYQGATTRFTHKINEFIRKRVSKPKLKLTLAQYVLAHQQIVIQNMAEELANSQPAAPAAPEAAPGTPSSFTPAGAAPRAGQPLS